MKLISKRAEDDGEGGLFVVATIEIAGYEITELKNEVSEKLGRGVSNIYEARRLLERHEVLTKASFLPVPADQL